MTESETARFQLSHMTTISEKETNENDSRTGLRVQSGIHARSRIPFHAQLLGRPVMVKDSHSLAIAKSANSLSSFKADSHL